MDWSAPIDAYCERSSAAFWAEPLNAVSNGAFLAAAFAAFLLNSKAWRGDAGWWCLVCLMVAIGIGSFLFHTAATRWAALADVLPITVFIHLYLYLAMRRLMEIPVRAALPITAGFFLGSVALERVAPEGALNGSSGYLPPLLAILVVGLLLLRTRPAAARPVLAAGGVFVVSLVARTSDEAVCAVLPTGLHFLWHVLNALVLYLLVRALLIHGRPGWVR